MRRTGGAICAHRHNRPPPDLLIKCGLHSCPSSHPAVGHRAHHRRQTFARIHRAGHRHHHLRQPPSHLDHTDYVSPRYSIRFVHVAPASVTFSANGYKCARLRAHTLECRHVGKVLTRTSYASVMALNFSGSPPLSGWFLTASLRYAFLISAAPASFEAKHQHGPQVSRAAVRLRFKMPMRIPKRRAC
eukprot:SAG11_NODE_1782_length_4261_cov_2.796732_6_plen_188_part_00